LSSGLLHLRYDGGCGLSVAAGKRDPPELSESFCLEDKEVVVEINDVHDIPLVKRIFEEVML
jgi:hypothetical protein